MAKAKDSHQLPEVPYPRENQPNEAKRLLGKILFWDEQLSTDNSIACGSCHLPSANGADPRIGIAPGFDNVLNTKDDILGSLGVVSRNHLGQITPHTVFQTSAQVTGRTAQSFFGGLWARNNFWDGRATSEFIAPETGEITIRSGAALENQALGPLMSDVEMAKKGQTAADVITKLEQSSPLALASNFPPDIKMVLRPHKNNNETQYTKMSYPQLFENAFGDAQISLTRIAFAIATYERTLVADQTPWDLAMEGKMVLGFKENLGFEFFKQNGCAQCHKPPLFTDNKFYNIGIQGRNTDQGRQLISGKKQDKGAMKTPSLRNVALKKTFMHSGQFTSLEQVIDAYADVPFKQLATALPDGKKYDFQFTETQRKSLIAFMNNALTDTRVKNELFPFDRPTLRSEIISSEKPVPVNNVNVTETSQGKVLLSWEDMNKSQLGHDVEIVRNDGRHFWASQSPFTDIYAEAGYTYQYQIYVRNAQREWSLPVSISITMNAKILTLTNGLLLLSFLVFLWIIRERLKTLKG